MPARAGAGWYALSSPRGFAQDTAQTASTQWRTVADQIRPKAPKLAVIMDEADPDVLACMTFSNEHRAKLHSTTRLVGALLLKQNDEWAVQRARYITLETMAPLSVRQGIGPPDQFLIFLTPLISLPVVAR